jgi:uncharacterized protein with HEPN domain
VSKPWPVYAEHILDAIAKLRRIQARGDVTSDEVLYAASLRHLQTRAEATQRLPEQLKQAHPAIPWQDTSGFRNILVHNYLGDIDPATVATVLQHDLPPLEAGVLAMLAARTTDHAAR